MARSEEIQVVGRDGLSGTVLYPLPRSNDEYARVQLDNGQIVEVPADTLSRRADGLYEIPFGPSDFRSVPVERPRRADTDEAVVPILAEELEVGKRSTTTGGVRVNRRIVEHDEVVEMPLRTQRVDVRRVVLNRDVDGPLPARKEGDTTIIPVVEEVLVVSKRFVLKEEIHITSIVREELHRENVTVRRQEAEIERVDDQGRTKVEAPSRLPRRSILGE